MSDEPLHGVGSFMDVVEYAMLGFAGMAFLHGVFLIIDALSMVPPSAPRDGSDAAIGSSRKQVNRSVLVEAVAYVGVLADPDVGAGVGLRGRPDEAHVGGGHGPVHPRSDGQGDDPVIGLVLVVVVAVLAACCTSPPGRPMLPMAALRDAGTPADGEAGLVRGIIGLVLTGAGTLALLTAAGADKASDGSLVLGAGILLTLIGFVIIGPLLAGGVVRVISAVLLRFFGPVGRMAERNALRNPRRTGATGAALMIGLALVACLSVGLSMVASATDELDKTVGTDFIIQGNQRIVPQAAKAIETTPGLEHVTHYRDIEAEIVAPDGSSDGDGVTAADPTYAQDLHRKTTAGELTAAYGRNPRPVGSLVRHQAPRQARRHPDRRLQGRQHGEAQGRRDHRRQRGHRPGRAVPQHRDHAQVPPG